MTKRDLLAREHRRDARRMDAAVPAFEALEQRLLLSETIIGGGIGAAYEVWGGATDYRPQPDGSDHYYNIQQQDYDFLGAADATATFSGDYPFYVVAARYPVGVDAVEGSDGAFAPGSSYTGNTRDPQNMGGAPDGLSALVGTHDAPDSFRGFALIENPGSWTDVTVHTTPLQSQILEVFVEREANHDATGQPAGYEYGIEVGGIDLVSMVAVTPWGDPFLSSDYLPAGWAGEDFETTGPGFDLEAYSEGPERFIDVEWYDLSAAQWADVGSNPGSIIASHLAGGWRGAVNASDVLMPQQIPNITSPLDGQTDAPLLPTVRWEQWTVPPIGDGVSVDLESQGEGPWHDVGEYLPPNATSWAPPQPLEPWGQYRAFVDFVNAGLQTIDGVEVVVLSGTSGTVFFETIGGPDLLISDTGSPSIQAQPGQQVDVPVEVFNAGDESAWYFDVSLFRSQDPFVDQYGDARVGWYNVQELAPNTPYGETISFTAPSQPGHYYLAAMADPYGSVQPETDPSNNWGATIDLLVGEVVIEGSVYDYDTHLPLANIEVQAYQGWEANSAGQDAWDYVGSAWTGADGHYEVFSLPDRQYRLRIWDGQGAGGKNYMGADLFNVPVAAGQTTSGMDFFLREAGYLYGYVFDELGNPVDNAEVVVEAEYTHMEDASDWHNAWTDGSGRYEIFLAPTDQAFYPVEVNRASNYGATYQVYGTNDPAAMSADLYADPTAQGFDYLGQSAATSTFAGGYEYYLVRTKPGYRAEIDALEFDAGVYFTGGGTWSGGAWNGSWNGFYGAPDGAGPQIGDYWNIAYLGLQAQTPPADFTVHVVDRGHPADRVTYGSQIDASLYAAEIAGTRGPDFYLSPGGTVRGRVTNEAGDPLADVTPVDLVAPIDGGTIWRGERTNSNGEYRIDSIPAGVDFWISTSEGWGPPFEIDGVMYAWGERQIGPFNLAAGQTLDVGTLVIPRAAAISGTVRDPQGNPIPGVWLDGFGFDIAGGEIWLDEYDVFTNELGYYEIDTVPAGRVTISAEADGYLDYNSDTELVLSPGDGATWDFTMIPASQGATFAGSIVNFDEAAPTNDALVPLPYEIIDYDDYGRIDGIGVIGVAYDPSRPWTSDELLQPDRRLTAHVDVEDGYGDYFVPSADPAGTYQMQIPLSGTGVVAYRSGPTATGGWANNLSDVVVPGVLVPGQTLTGVDLLIRLGDSSVGGEIFFPQGYNRVLSESSVAIFLGEVGQPAGALGVAMGNPGMSNLYELPDLPAGEYYVFAVADGLAMFVSDPFTLGADSTFVQDIVFDYDFVGGRISGYVWRDLNGNGAWDEGEPPLANRKVYLDDDNDGVKDPGERGTPTDANGYYVFDQLAPRSYNVRQDIPPGWQETFPPAPYEGVWAPDPSVGSLDFGARLLPEIEIVDSSDDPLDLAASFGEAPVGQPDGLNTFGLFNLGDDTLEVSNLALDNTTDFVMTVTDAQGSPLQGSSFAIAPGESITLDVQFTPSETGALYGQITFDTNDYTDGEDAVTLLLDGVGEVGGPPTYAIADYFPLIPGLVRTYFATQINPGKVLPVRSIVRTVFEEYNLPQAGEEYLELVQTGQYELKKFYDGRHESSTFYAMDATGLQLLGQDYLDRGNWRHTAFSPAMAMLPAEVTEGMTTNTTVGWHRTDGGAPIWTGQYTQQMDVLGFEQILLPAGDQNAMKIRFTITADKTGAAVGNVTINDQYTAWLVRDMGVVRQEGVWRETVNGRDYEWRFTYQLVSSGVGAEAAPDLVGRFDDRFVMPQAVVPGRSMRVPIVIQNLGGETAEGRIAVEISASQDQFLDAGDVLLGRLENIAIRLAPGASKTVYVNVQIPAGMPVGGRFFLASIDTDNNIAEFYEDNNVAFTSSAAEWMYAFGNVGGQRNVSLVMDDGLGTPIEFRLRGSGYGEVTRDEGGHLNVAFHGTDNRSTATFRTARGFDGVVNDITLVSEAQGGGASLRSLLANTTDLIGDISAPDGWIGTLKLDDVADDHVIVIGGAGRPISMTFDSMGDTSIFAAPAIRSLTATEWLDENDTPDQIVTPWLGNLRITGSRSREILGHFGADLILSGQGAARTTLGRVNINGDLYGAEWNIVGKTSNLTVGGIIENTTIRATQGMGAISFGAAVNSDFLAGVGAGVSRHAASVADFADTGAKIQSVTARGVRLAGVEEALYFVENSNFSAAAIGRVSLLNVAADNGGERFGLFALASSAGGGEITSLRYRNTATGESWTWRPADGVLNLLDFTAQVLDAQPV